jgi:hypothetical protein
MGKMVSVAEAAVPGTGQRAALKVRAGGGRATGSVPPSRADGLTDCAIDGLAAMGVNRREIRGTSGIPR